MFNPKKKFVEYMENKSKSKKTNEKNTNTSKEKKAKRPKVNQSRKLNFSKNRVSKIVSVTLIALIVISVLFNFIFYSKYQTIRNTVKESEKTVQKQLKSISDSKEGQSDKSIYFAEQFLNDYYKIPKNENDRKEHLNELKKYFYSDYDIESLYDLENFNGSQSFENAKYIKKEIQNNGVIVIHFNVDYKITNYEKVTKEREVKKGKKKVKEKYTEEKPVDKNMNSEIAIKVKSKNGGYVLTENPRLNKSSLYTKATKDQVVKSSSNDNSISSDKKLNESIQDFFKAYGNNDEKLQLLSSVNEGLNNQELTDSQILNAYQKDNKIYVTVFVTYQSKDTSLNTNYTYNLEMTKNKSNYYVENINS